MTAIEFNHELLSYQNPLKYFALKLTSDNEDAEDLLQETLLKALKYRDKFQDKTNLKAWLYTIMKNTFINNYRRKVRKRTIMDNTDDDYFVNSGFENIETIIHAGAFIPKSNSDANYINGSNSNIISTTKLLSSTLPKLKKFIFRSTFSLTRV